MRELVKKWWRRLTGRPPVPPDERAQLAVTLAELDAQLTQIRKAIVAPLAREKRLRLDLEDLLAQATQWKGRARLALKAGDRELARQAVVEAATRETRAREMQSEWAEQRRSGQQLEAGLLAAKRRVDEVRQRATMLVARHQAAAAQQQIANLLTRQGDGSLERLLSSVDERILELETQSGVSARLLGDGPGGDLEERFRALEVADNVERDLASLEASLSEPPPQRAAPSEPEPG